MHTWIKYGKDTWKTVTYIEELMDKQMIEQSEIAYLPKCADLYVKLKLNFW